MAACYNTKNVAIKWSTHKNDEYRWSNGLRKQRKLAKHSVAKTMHGGCCCMKWNGGKGNIKHSLDYLYFLVGFFFSFFIGRFFFVLPLLRLLCVCTCRSFSVSSPIIYTFSWFLMCKRHTSAPAIISQCMVSHKQKC